MTLRKKIGRAMDALSLANAGEMLTYRDKHRIIEEHLDLPDRMEARAIAVSLESGLGGRMLDYLIDACQRLKADLVVFADAGNAQAESELSRSDERLQAAGISYRLVQLSGDWGRAVSRYVGAHREILFLALSALDSKGQSVLGQHRHLHPQIPVPLVMIDEATP